MREPAPTGRPTVAVIGAGVSGLTLAFELLERSERLPEGIDVVCLEAGDQPGGNILTVRREGFTCEWGPNGFLDNSPPTLTLVRRLGLQDRTLRADEAAEKRFIYRAGRLREVPTTPGAFLASGILPLHGKLRLLAEPLVPARKGNSDESVFGFASRRIGRLAAGVLVDAMVTGIYAGDVRSLSLPATFPKMREMETRHGSLFRAMLARRKQGGSGGPAGPGGRLTSFREGMQELTDALAHKIGGALRRGVRVRSVSDMGRRGIRVHPERGAPFEVDAAVLACPAWYAADLVRDTDPEMSGAMAAIPSAPLVVVHLGFRAAAVGGAPRGFGFLVPRGQGVRLLGTLWSSSIFENRAPEGSVLMTCMVGGAHDPEANGLDDRELIRIVRADLEKTMKLTAPHYFAQVMRHPRGIPQYTLGHLERVAKIEARLRERHGLFVCGNSYRGISVNLCVEEAPKVAEAVLARVTESSAAHGL